RDSSSSSHLILLLVPSNPRARLYPVDLGFLKHERLSSLQISEKETKSEVRHRASLLCRIGSRKAYIVSQRCQPTPSPVQFGSWRTSPGNSNRVRPSPYRRLRRTTIRADLDGRNDKPRKGRTIEAVIHGEKAESIL